MSHRIVKYTIEVAVPDDQQVEFEQACTGNDDDIILAAETAMRERIGRRYDEPELELIGRKEDGAYL